MAYGCGDKCGKCTPYVISQPGIPGPAGDTPTITVIVQTLPPGSEASIQVNGVSPNLVWVIGIPAGMTGATPVLVGGTTTTLAPGSPATGTLVPDPVVPNRYILNFGVPRGRDGWGTAFPTLDPMTMPAPGTSTDWVTIGDNRMVEVGTWVKLDQGASVHGDWFVVSAKTSDDVVKLRNPGPADLGPYWPGATSIPSNTPTGHAFAAGRKGVVVGAPGLQGRQGVAGVGPTTTVVTDVPLTPPVSEADTLRLATDSLTAPTWQRMYAWDATTSTWVPGPNMIGARGARTFFGGNDPNLIPVPGSQPGDVFQRTNVSVRETYSSLGGGSWSLQDTLSLMGTDTTTVTHDTPGAYVVDAAGFSYLINADKDIELDVSGTNYAGQGSWTVQIKNNDGSPIGLTYATSKWERDSALTLPSTVTDGKVATIRFVKNMSTGRYIITDAFESTTV